MISHIKGTVIFKTDKHLTVDVSGIGYKVAVTTETLQQGALGKELSLWTYLAVREDALDLYGFPNRDDLNFFELLLTVSSIGPKSAIGILNVAHTETLRTAVTSGDTSYLTRVSGIGKKTADKIVHELKDRIGSTDNDAPSGTRGDVDAVDALRALGYSLEESRDALKEVPKDISNIGERVKAALKILGKK